MIRKTIYVESSTDLGTFYKVTEEIEKTITCTCKGFTHRGNCKHTKELK